MSSSKDSYNLGANSYSSFWQKPHDFIEEDRKEFLNLIPKSGKILDIGCGPGMDSEYFSNLGFEVIGIDQSEGMIKIASKRAPYAHFQVCNMKELDLPESSFNGIWSSFSFLHVEKKDATKVLKSFYKILTPEGTLFLGLHTNKESNYNERKITGLSTKDGNQLSVFVQEWNKKEIISLLERAGFKIKLCREFTRKGGWYPLLSIIAQK